MLSGPNPFKITIKGKPIPIGFRVFAACCPISGFCKLFEFDSKPKKRKIWKLMMDLLGPDLKPGQTVYCDRYFTTYALARKLMEKQVGLVGMIAKGRDPAKKIIDLHQSEKKDPRGTFKVATNPDGNVCSIVWKDNGVCRMLCTTGTTVQTTVWRKVKRQKKKIAVVAPTVATTYMQYFNGVDIIGQRTHY